MAQDYVARSCPSEAHGCVACPLTAPPDLQMARSSPEMSAHWGSRWRARPTRTAEADPAVIDYGLGAPQDEPISQYLAAISSRAPPGLQISRSALALLCRSSHSRTGFGASATNNPR